MSLVARFLTDGGIPDGWSVENLRWLAQAHRRLTGHPATTGADIARSQWHLRWATLIEDVLESRYVQNN